MFLAESLLNPIRDDVPSGADLSFSPELDAITEARKFDDPSLDQGEWLTELREADWDLVFRRCAGLLQQKSKDLRLAVWLAEAAARKYGMRGLGEGLLVIAGLLDKYWERGLYPQSDGEDHEQRLGNIGWILTRIPALLREMPVTDGAGKRYTTIDFEQARRNRNAEPKLSDLESARRANSPQFLAEFAADAHYCRDALLRLEQSADERLGKESPGFSSAREAIEAMLRMMPPTGAVPSGKQHCHSLEDEHRMPGMSRQPDAGPQGAINTRAQAIAQLRAVAEFFRRTEPHSPVSYYAEKAADAGEQDLHSWLRSVVKDPASLSHIEELLGVNPHTVIT